MNNNTVRPRVVEDVGTLRQTLELARRQGKRIGLVPTMGALHEGHLSLVRASKQECDCTVVSIYVNPTQFGPHEDLDKYPRTLEADLDALAACGVELVFLPADTAVYGPSHTTFVEVGPVAEPLEGEYRPGHLRGVATIVLKLFNMVGADVVYFGQKDYQQALVVRRMVEDLDVPIAVRTCPTVREPDGLAMSSRNAYLSPEARHRARVLYESLELAKDLLDKGERDAATIVGRMREVIEKKGTGPFSAKHPSGRSGKMDLSPFSRIDYIVMADPDTLEPVTEITGRTLLALAVKIDDTRLIDNTILIPNPQSPIPNP